MTDHIAISREGGITRVQMNRPDKKNAITGAMYNAMTAEIEQAAANGTRVIIWAGVPGAFSAGNDLMDFLSFDPSSDKTPAFNFIRALARATVPMVAAVDGLAIGIGTTMLFHCDLVYVTARAYCRMPFVDLALVPEAGSSLIGPRLMGQQRAAAAFLLGEAITPEAGVSMGLFNAVVGEAELEATAMAAAKKLASKPPEALALTRRLLRGDPEEIVARIDEEGRIFRERLKSAEAKAAFMAFMNKGK